MKKTMKFPIEIFPSHSKPLKIASVLVFAFNFGIGILFGLVVIKYDFSTGRHTINSIGRIWAIIFAICLLILYPFAFFQMSLFDEAVEVRSVQGFVTILHVTLNYISIIFVYLLHTLRAEQLIEIINAKEKLHDILLPLTSADVLKFVWCFVIQYTRKALLLTIFFLTIGSLYIEEMNKLLRTSGTWSTAFTFFCPYCVQTFAANFFFLGLLRTELYFKIINQIIEKAIEDANKEQTLRNNSQVEIDIQTSSINCVGVITRSVL
uniref:Uncharacterized protein n=1 Tax=Lutzomyia longipalpis TaxID=7200 RepID=A0A905HMZ6_LUTLO